MLHLISVDLLEVLVLINEKNTGPCRSKVSVLILIMENHYGGKCFRVHSKLILVIFNLTSGAQ